MKILQLFLILATASSIFAQLPATCTPLPAGSQPPASVPASVRPEEPGATVSVRLEPDAALARLITRVEPTYAELARKTCSQGDVQLDVIVGEDGAVRNVYFRGGPALLLDSALEAVAQWKFRPLIQDGKPVAFRTAVTIPFVWHLPSLREMGTTKGIWIKYVQPVYPALAKTTHSEGKVVISVIIAKDGQIKEANVVSGPALLRQAALDAVRQWEYKPYLLSGAAVDVVSEVVVTFALDKPVSTNP